MNKIQWCRLIKMKILCLIIYNYNNDSLELFKIYYDRMIELKIYFP